MPPNTPHNFYGIKVSKTGVPVNDATDKQLIYKDDFSTKTYFDNTNSRMLEGKLPDGSYGLWVSKPGFDVTTATDNDLVFNSSRDVFKIITSGTTPFTIPNGAANSTFDVTFPLASTNLGYPPLVMGSIFINSVSLLYTMPFSLPVVSGGNYVFGLLAQFTTQSDGISVEFWGKRDGAGTPFFPTGTLRWYVLQETAATS